MKTRSLLLFLLLNFSGSFITLTAQLTAIPDGNTHIYLLRGIGRESAHWGTAFTEELKLYLPQAKIHFLDLPGLGQYHHQKALGSIEKMADFLHSELGKLPSNTHDKHILFATSLAGIVALEWQRKYPSDFDGIAMAGSSFKGLCPPGTRIQKDAKKMFIKIFLTKDPVKRERAFIEINSNTFAAKDSLLDKWVAIQLQRPVKSLKLAKQTLAGAFYKTPEKAPEIPIMLLGSKADRILGYECLCRVADYLQADLAVHETAGHALPLDAPVWLADTLGVWINDRILSPNKATMTVSIKTATSSSNTLR